MVTQCNANRGLAGLLYVLSPWFSKERATHPTLQEYCFLQKNNFLSPLMYVSFLCLLEVENVGRASSGISQHALWRGSWLLAGLSLSLECGVIRVFSSQLWAQPPFWDKKGKNPFGRLSCYFMKLKHSAFQHGLFSAWSEKVFNSHNLTRCLSNRAWSPDLTLALCKYLKIFFFFFCFKSHEHRAL